MKPNQKRESERWLLQAERDFDDGRFSSQGKRYNLACFLAQQSAEKAIKAFLYSQGIEEVWGHSVAELCADAQKLDADFKELMKNAASLDKYYIPTRYPNGLPGGIPSDVYQKEDASQALFLASKIIEFVKGKIKFK